MSFNFESVGKQIAVIKNKNDTKAKEKKVFYQVIAMLRTIMTT